MNTYNINDESFINSDIYDRFIKENPVNGYLKIRAYSASQAIPVRGLKIVVSTNFEDNNIIFYDGFTDASGIIEKITLPAPRLSGDNLYVPNKIVYDIKANYPPNLVDLKYQVNMYEDVFVIQNINIVPGAETGGY